MIKNKKLAPLLEVVSFDLEVPAVRFLLPLPPLEPALRVFSLLPALHPQSAPLHSLS